MTCLCNTTSQAAESVSIVFVDLPMLLSNDPTKRGRYNYVFEELHENLKNKPQIIYMPAKRAYMTFDKQHFDCIFPANNSVTSKKDQLVISKSFGEAHAYIFTLSDMPVIKSIEQLAGKTLGVRRGFDYGGYRFISSLRLIEVDSVQQNLLMLANKRLDAFVAYEPDALSIFDEAKDIMIHRDDTYTIYSQFDQIACYDSPKTRAYISHINKTSNVLFPHSTL